jgi:16S rRNA C967 or C1407 C5-methylase (RsmB/RsmF family)
MSDCLTDPNLKFGLALIAGSFSLLGGIIGGWVARHTEKEKWLRQNRSEVFAKFLDLLAHARSEATSALHDTNTEPLQRDIRVTEAYTVPEEYARVVRFYLPQKHREEFMRLVREIRGLHSSVSLGDSRLNTLEKKLVRIQDILESTIGG